MWQLALIWLKARRWDFSWAVAIGRLRVLSFATTVVVTHGLIHALTQGIPLTMVPMIL